jgi:curved DNA-binding protein CbpA
LSQLNKYFLVLGIHPTKDKNTIKKAYRKQAMQYHPDKNPSEDAQSKFIEITEAYEILTGQAKKGPTNPKGKSTEQARAEKIRRAKERYQKMRNTEKDKDAKYYKKITTAWRWKTFRGLAIYSLIFSLLLTADYFMTGKQRAVSDYSTYSFLPKTVEFEGELFQILDSKYWINDFPPVRMNYGLFFKDLKSISVLDEPLDVNKNANPSDRRIRSQLFANFQSTEFYSYGSVYYIFPFFQICLLLPIILIKYKRPTINFAIGRLIAIWIIYPSVVYLSFSNGRILNLLGLL